MVVTRMRTGRHTLLTPDGALHCRPFNIAAGRVRALRADATVRHDVYLSALCKRHIPSPMALEVMKTDALTAAQVWPLLERKTSKLAAPVHGCLAQSHVDTVNSRALLPPHSAQAGVCWCTATTISSQLFASACLT